MTIDPQPEGIHILAADGSVVAANIPTLKAGRARARRLSGKGEPVILARAGSDYRRRYVNGYQGEHGTVGTAAMRDSAFEPVERLARDDGTDWTALVEALGDRERVVLASEFDANAPDARRCGIYAWWADERARRVIGDTLGADADSSIYDPAAPIYIGHTTQTLVHRVLCSHLDGIGKSTLRSTLAAILGATDSDPGRSSEPTCCPTG